MDNLICGRDTYSSLLSLDPFPPDPKAQALHEAVEGVRLSALLKLIHDAGD
jgi:hypothetical protein